MAIALTSASWWKAAGKRAGRTALIVAASYIPAANISLDPKSYLPLVSAGVLAGILSVITSLGGIAEADGKTVSPVWALVIRVVKSVAQAAIAAVPTSLVFFQDVNWLSVLQVAVVAGFGSLFLGLSTNLPETNGDQTAPADVPVPTTAISDIPVDAPVVDAPVVTPTVEAVPEAPVAPVADAAGTPAVAQDTPPAQ